MTSKISVPVSVLLEYQRLCERPVSTQHLVDLVHAATLKRTEASGRQVYEIKTQIRGKVARLELYVRDGKLDRVRHKSGASPVRSPEAIAHRGETRGKEPRPLLVRAARASKGRSAEEDGAEGGRGLTPTTLHPPAT